MAQQGGSQVVGNIGMYYAAYRLSQQGWNIMPTARNARGVDLLIYGVNAHIYKGIQVKALSKRSPVPLGNTLDGFIGDWWIYRYQCRRCQPGVLHHEAGGSQATCSQRRERV
jgi:hypothetical protein